MKPLSSFDSHLFLGFAVDSSFQKSFDLLNLKDKALFIQENDAYLQEYLFNEALFLGKYLEKKSDLNQINLFSLNIYSLLKKIVPNYSYDQSDLWLIPVIKVNSSV